MAMEITHGTGETTESKELTETRETRVATNPFLMGVLVVAAPISLLKQSDNVCRFLTRRLPDSFWPIKDGDTGSQSQIPELQRNAAVGL